MVLISLSGVLSVQGQKPFYTPDQVQEVRIYFTDPGWRSILDSLMYAGDDNTRIRGEVVIDGIRRPDAGIRYKGFSSWNMGVVKNPFNIEIDYLINNKNILGIKKIKLGNVIHDPSFIREALAYEIAGQYMPAPEAGFARLFVNDTLIGLYSNVESVDDLFAAKHFGNDKAFMVKGSPEKLIFPFGQNANLALLSSSDSSAYFPYYQLVSDYGWNALMAFTEVLSNKPAGLAHHLNIDRTLWMHAFNYALVNLDSYIGYAQNYYLVMDHHGRFNPVVWDLNMSFGSFRFSDGSYHFQGLTIDQAMKLDPLQHLIFSISPRPLLTNLLQDPTLKRKYIAHLRTIMKEQFESGRYLQQAQMWRDLITKDVQEDTNKFYSFSDYIDNVDVTVGGTGGMGAYPGIKYLVEGRIAYLSDYPGFTGEPVIIPGALLQRPYRGETAFITAEVSGGDEVWLHCRQSAADLFEEMRMYDDGLHGDGVAGDGIYGAGVVVSDDIIHYYFYAQNDSAGVFSPERAETSFYTVWPLVAEGVLVFNEVSPPGNAAMTGTAPARDGWIEIYNNSRDSVSLQGLWIEQCISALAWALPDSILPPGRFLLISVYGKTADALHAPALLSVPDGVLRLFYPGGIVVDSLSYCYIQGNTTLGRYPNGAGSFTLMPPTCGYRNAMGDISRHCLSVAPNPAIDHFDFAYLPETPRFSYKLLSSDGRVWFAEEFDAALPGIPVSVRVDISRFPQGIYFLHLTADTGNYSTKIIIIK